MKELYTRSAEAIILAGGRGTRMGLLTAEKQKCLLPIDEKPALFHILDNLVTAFGSVDVKIGVAYQSNQVKDAVEKYINKKNVSVTYVPHEEGAESAGAYKSMVPFVSGDAFIATPGDVIAKPSAYSDALRLFAKSDTPFSLTLSNNLNEIDTHGVATLSDGYVDSYIFPPPPKITDHYLRDMDIYGTNKAFFQLVNEYTTHGQAFSGSISEILRHTRIAGNMYKDQWVHIGYPEDLKKSMQEKTVYKQAS